jgi:hypothetical protein
MSERDLQKEQQRKPDGSVEYTVVSRIGYIPGNIDPFNYDPKAKGEHSTTDYDESKTLEEMASELTPDIDGIVTYQQASGVKQIGAEEVRFESSRFNVVNHWIDGRIVNPVTFRTMNPTHKYLLQEAMKRGYSLLFTRNRGLRIFGKNDQIITLPKPQS